MSHQPVWYRCRRLLLVRAAALKATKARGVELGRHGAEVLAATYEQEACRRAEQLEPVITELQSKSFLKQITTAVQRPVGDTAPNWRATWQVILSAAPL